MCRHAAPLTSENNRLQMTVFREFEIEAIRLMAHPILSSELLQAVLNEAELVGYEYTGSGYFLKVKHAALTLGKQTLQVPAVEGAHGNVVAGFVVFLDDGELTLECHSWGPVDVPEDFRDQNVIVAARI